MCTHFAVLNHFAHAIVNYLHVSLCTKNKCDGFVTFRVTHVCQNIKWHWLFKCSIHRVCQTQNPVHRVSLLPRLSDTIYQHIKNTMTLTAQTTPATHPVIHSNKASYFTLSLRGRLGLCTRAPSRLLRTAG